MQHFLDSFLHYAQYDVLESSYAKLLDAVQSQKEFESIQKLHRSFLSSVCSGLFVDAEDYRGVGRTVRTLLELCRKFAGVAERNIRAGSEAAVTAAVDELEEVGLRVKTAAFDCSRTNDQQFWLGMSSIYKTFSGVGSTLRQSLWLDQLVLRLDFNGFLR